MKRVPMICAVALAFALPCSAFGQETSVVLYGRLNLSTDFLSQNIIAGRQHLYAVSSNSSRFGIRGSESLGSGLSAIFQLENSLNVDAGSGTLVGRGSWVGLRSTTLGTITLGNFELPLDDLSGLFGNLSTSYKTGILNTATLWDNAASDQAVQDARFNNGLVQWTDRAKNSVRYDSPTFSGFSTSIQSSAYNESPGAARATINGANVMYAGGPVKAGVAYQSNHNLRGPGLKDDAYSGVVQYTFGQFYVAPVYGRQNYGATDGRDFRRDFVGLSGQWLAGPHRIHLHVGRAGDLKGPGGRADTGATHLLATYGYALSRRTVLYAGYANLNNDKNANYILPIVKINGVPGATESGFSMGMWHNF